MISISVESKDDCINKTIVLRDKNTKDIIIEFYDEYNALLIPYQFTISQLMFIEHMINSLLKKLLENK